MNWPTVVLILGLSFLALLAVVCGFWLRFMWGCLKEGDERFDKAQERIDRKFRR